MSQQAWLPIVPHPPCRTGLISDVQIIEMQQKLEQAEQARVEAERKAQEAAAAEAEKSVRDKEEVQKKLAEAEREKEAAIQGARQGALEAKLEAERLAEELKVKAAQDVEAATLAAEQSESSYAPCCRRVSPMPSAPIVTRADDWAPVLLCRASGRGGCYGRERGRRRIRQLSAGRASKTQGRPPQKNTQHIQLGTNKGCAKRRGDCPPPNTRS